MKISLLKYIFLVSIIMTPIIAISDVKVPGAVVVNDGAITNNCNGWHKLPPQQFVVFIDKPKVDSIYMSRENLSILGKAGLKVIFRNIWMRGGEFVILSES